MSEDGVRFQGLAEHVKLWDGNKKEPGVGVFSVDPEPVRQLDTIPCPACSKIAWLGADDRGLPALLGRAESFIFGLSTVQVTACQCGRGQAMRREWIQPAEASREWHVRVCGAEELRAHDEWRREEPKRWQPWPTEDLAATCPACDRPLVLAFSPNHQPGEIVDEEDPVTHSKTCNCGAHLALCLPEVERLEYGVELAAWQDREPKIEEWHLPA